MTFTCVKCGKDYEAEDSPSDYFCNQYCSTRYTDLQVSQADKVDRQRAAEERGEDPAAVVEVPVRAYSPMGLFAYAQWLAGQASATEVEDEDDEG